MFKKFLVFIVIAMASISAPAFAGEVKTLVDYQPSEWRETCMLLGEEASKGNVTRWRFIHLNHVSSIQRVVTTETTPHLLYIDTAGQRWSVIMMADHAQDFIVAWAMCNAKGNR